MLNVSDQRSTGHHRGAGAMSPVVQITAGHAVELSPNNGIDIMQYEPGEFYSVPEHVARSMIRRGWAKLSPGGESPPEPKPEEPKPAPPPPPIREPDDDDDEDEDAKRHSRRAKRSDR